MATNPHHGSEVQFKRVLKNRDVMALAFGAMVGWGWVVLAGTQVSNAGAGGAMLAFLLGGAVICLIGLTYAELAAAMPKAGGEHIYSYRALGAVGAFVCTWAIVLGYVSVVAFEAVALPTVVEYIFPGYAVGHLWTIAGWDVKFTWVLVGVFGAVAMTWVNIRGIRFAALVQSILTAALTLVGILLIAGAITVGDSANMDPMFTGGMAGLFSVVIMVPFLFVGFDVIPQAAEEIDLPFNKIGRLLVFSVVITVVWYALIVMSVGLGLNQQQLANSDLATADAMANLFGGEWAGNLLVFGGVCGILTSWNSFFIGGSRAVYAMARSRMLPAFLGTLHPEHRTPTNAILLIGALSVIAPFFGRSSLVWLVDAGGLGIIVAYIAVAISFVLLRKNEPDMPRPFKVPFGNAVGYTAIVLAIGIALLYMPGSPSALAWPAEWIIVLVWSAVGAGFFYWARMRYGAEACERIMAEEIHSIGEASTNQ